MDPGLAGHVRFVLIYSLPPDYQRSLGTIKGISSFNQLPITLRRRDFKGAAKPTSFSELILDPIFN